MEKRSKAETQELPLRGDSRPSIDAVPYRISVGGGRRNRNTQLIETLEELGRVTASAVEKIERGIELDAERSWQFVLCMAVGTIGTPTASDRADAIRCVELVQRASAALSAGGGQSISNAQVLWLMQSSTGSFAPLAAVVAISETRSYQDLCPRGLVQRVRAWIKS